MIKTFNNRTKMKQSYFHDFDATSISRNDIRKKVYYIDTRIDMRDITFSIVAISRGIHDVNGAIVKAVNKNDSKIVSVFAIMKRNKTLLEFL